MKNCVRYISALICFSIVFTLFGGFTSEKNVENENVKITRDKKILSDATIDQDFEDCSVIVIMDNIAGEINKRHELSFFGDIGATLVI
ncbi:MAG: hypothetical protein IJ404_04485 [Clostridia bacterium]|nr:hypothetical protein [Clostridia bacterium]